jgi:hypothetical protein
MVFFNNFNIPLMHGYGTCYSTLLTPLPSFVVMCAMLLLDKYSACNNQCMLCVSAVSMSANITETLRIYQWHALCLTPIRQTQYGSTSDFTSLLTPETCIMYSPWQSTCLGCTCHTRSTLSLCSCALWDVLSDQSALCTVTPAFIHPSCLWSHLL